MNKKSLCTYRWLLKSDRDLGVILFASDFDLKNASECEIIVGDGTFEICPRNFRQLYTLHGLVYLKNNIY